MTCFPIGNILYGEGFFGYSKHLKSLEDKLELREMWSHKYLLEDALCFGQKCCHYYILMKEEPTQFEERGV